MAFRHNKIALPGLPWAIQPSATVYRSLGLMFLLFPLSKPRVSPGKLSRRPIPRPEKPGAKPGFRKDASLPGPNPGRKTHIFQGEGPNGIQRTSEQRPNGRQRIKPETSGFLRRLPGGTFCRRSFSRKFFSMRAISMRAPAWNIPLLGTSAPILPPGAPPSWKKPPPEAKRQKNNGDPAIGTHHPFLAYLHLLYLIE